jgi:tight adherence protein C
LRVYAEEMREKRRMRAEEKAHRLPVLISIPLVVFMLPTMIGVIMLPAAIRMVRDVFPLMTGG